MVVIIMLKVFVLWLRIKFGRSNVNCLMLGVCNMPLKCVCE